uniref:SMP-30/Gluconolactonase/LRE-like region domain-containing protein n=1 Tax=Chromera velia CCMP2878 TaxID=1169474 RepID=A0A0G4FBD1_9ALVE|eukprot:Cvel_16128.t1-p1 / transcript=Cvel_16128.t1 / gene=Cvel_16128 / organism=Chromera_velia_CCMP2878 / gene_product=hypothetical protein / transcript_product=hypothetical protein / location=Cvel_scaffold1227:27879-31415(-) / protein_length=386 / sequence_SO=supercontig / SO=protein_coding / is_pseudo=false
MCAGNDSVKILTLSRFQEAKRNGGSRFGRLDFSKEGRVFCVFRGGRRRVTTSSERADECGGDGRRGVAPEEVRLRSPSSVALDRFGNVYISDTGNHCIRLLLRRKGEGELECVVVAGVPGRAAEEIRGEEDNQDLSWLRGSQRMEGKDKKEKERDQEELLGRPQQLCVVENGKDAVQLVFAESDRGQVRSVRLYTEKETGTMMRDRETPIETIMGSGRSPLQRNAGPVKRNETSVPGVGNASEVRLSVPLGVACDCKGEWLFVSDPPSAVVWRVQMGRKGGERKCEVYLEKLHLQEDGNTRWCEVVAGRCYQQEIMMKSGKSTREFWSPMRLWSLWPLPTKINSLGESGRHWQEGRPRQQCLPHLPWEVLDLTKSKEAKARGAGEK